jgi:hypothetical protein
VKRKDGLCPLTPEEVVLVLRALDIDKSMQIYIAAGEIYGGKRRMASLTLAYPNVVWTKCFTCELRHHCCIVLSSIDLSLSCFH